MGRKPKKQRRAKQLSIPAAETALSKAVDQFIENKNETADLKIEQANIEKTILEEMKREGRELMEIPNGGERYSFEIVKGERLRCAKITKTPVSDNQPDLDLDE